MNTEWLPLLGGRKPNIFGDAAAARIRYGASHIRARIASITAVGATWSK